MNIGDRVLVKLDVVFEDFKWLGTITRVTDSPYGGTCGVVLLENSKDTEWTVDKKDIEVITEEEAMLWILAN